MKVICGLTVLLMAVALGGVGVGQESSGGVKAGSDAAAGSGSQAGVGDMAPGDSHVRIVRLSEAQGKVGLDRKTGRGIEPTMRNMPIVEGGLLLTGDGVAEVEFEDGSTLRVAPDSLIQFPQLVLRASGAKATTVKLLNGTMYVSLLGTKGNEFTVLVADRTIEVTPSTHLRLGLDAGKVELAVFGGSAEVQAGSGTTVVGKKQTLKVDLAGHEPEMVAKNVAPEQYDAWDKESIGYHERYSNASSFAGSPYSYGISDLNYYGSFMDVGGCGSMWQPYFVNAAWNPYSNGVWAMYPGAGYSWVSPYPWGWMPFHSGSWAFCPGAGWGWQPGSNWVGLNNVVATTRGPSKLRPPLPPGPGHPTLVVANATPLVASRMGAPGQFVFQKNSAGLGVPRGSMGNLNRISRGVEQHGFVSREVYAAPLATGAGVRGPGMSSGPITLRAGTRNGGAEGEFSAARASMQSMHSSGGGASGGGASGGGVSGGASHSMGGGVPSGAGGGGGAGSGGGRAK